MTRVNPRDVQVREIRREDFADMQSYFFESSAEFLNSIGLKTPRPGGAEEYAAAWRARFTEREAGGAPIPVLTVWFKGERVGFHPTTHRVPGRSLIMHAHFFREDLRGKGIGTISYVLAIESYLRDYGYEEVIFKTPLQNQAPMRIKAKLGLEPIGEETVDWPETIGPLPCRVFKVTKAELPSLRARAGLGSGS